MILIYVPSPLFAFHFEKGLPQSPSLALKSLHHPWTCEVSKLVILVLQPSKYGELQLAPPEAALDWSLKQLNWDGKEKDGMQLEGDLERK